MDIHLQIIEELKLVAKKVLKEEVAIFIQMLQKAKSIFICGEGRSLLIGKAFAMRLMQAEFPVYVTGETVTPRIHNNDVLVVISGSGNTPTVEVIAKQAMQAGAKIVCITANRKSRIQRIANHLLLIPAATKNHLINECETIQPLSSQFDQSALLLLDAIVIKLIEGRNMEENMKNNHTNLQ